MLFRSLADGVVTEAEQEVLERLRRQYRLSEEAVKGIMEEIRNEHKEV